MILWDRGVTCNFIQPLHWASVYLDLYVFMWVWYVMCVCVCVCESWFVSRNPLTTPEFPGGSDRE